MVLAVVLAIFAMFCVSCATVGTPRAATEETFRVEYFSPITVDYSRTLAEMIKASGYNCAVKDFLEECFPIKKDFRTHETTKQIKPALVEVSGTMSILELLDMLDQQGLRPAKLEDQLAFGEAHLKQLTGTYELYALGTGRTQQGSFLTPSVGMVNGIGNGDLIVSIFRSLYYPLTWSKEHRFLVVVE